MTRGLKEFRLYPRKPRQRITYQSKVLVPSRSSVSCTSRACPARNVEEHLEALPLDREKRFNQRCAVRVIFSRNKTAGQWRAHGRYLMRDSDRAAGGSWAL